MPPAQDDTKEKQADEQIAIDLGDEYEQALSSATQEEIIDLAGKSQIWKFLIFQELNKSWTTFKNWICNFSAILGFHSMMNQDQYHASLLNSGQPVGLGWDGITKASKPKVYPMDPPNDTDIDSSIKRVGDDDKTLVELNWNNIKVLFHFFYFFSFFVS